MRGILSTIHIRKVDEIYNVCERILNMCDACPAIVQFHQNQPRRPSNQDIPPVLSQMSIQDIVTILFLLVLAILVIVVMMILWKVTEFEAWLQSDPEIMKRWIWCMDTVPRILGSV
ncbi:hypothetical protein PENTCL1PPCAC_10049, partial [Pristionchus entomophagus]